MVRPVPHDPELSEALQAWRAVAPFPVTHDRIEALRAFVTEGDPTDELLAQGGAYSVEHRSIDGPAGCSSIDLLICKPTDARNITGAIYHTHGGGMMAGSRRTGMDRTLELASEFGLAVVSVEYRLAPEHPAPAAVEDCYAGYVWTLAHAHELGIDQGRIIVLGVSAGGGLAAGTVLLALERDGPSPLGQMLIAPMMDDRNMSLSSIQMAGRGTWDQVSNATGWRAALAAAQGGEDVARSVAPSRATDLLGLPPTYIDVGSAETFRDEAIDFAAKIWAGGGVAELHVMQGGFHGFDFLVPRARISESVGASRRNWLRRLLTPTG
jgi:acetyl esterase/lipase